MLKKRFTPMQMLLVSINGIIGSAWLFAPRDGALIAGSGVLISWLLGGAATILIALTFAELSSLLPIAGGTTRFAQLTQGTTTGFIISWVSWLSCVTMPPIEVQAVLQCGQAIINSAALKYHWLMLAMNFINHNSFVSHMPLHIIFATLIMLSLCLLNIASFKGFVSSNLIIFAFKILVIILTVILLIKTHFTFSNFHWQNAGHGFSWQAVLAAVGTGGIVFAFTGFKHGVELAGETKNSQLAIPLSIVGSVIVCLILYLALQIAFIGAIEPKWLVHGWSALTFDNITAPFLGLASILGLVWLYNLLMIDTVVSPLGAGLIYVTSTARIIYAMSRNGFLPKIFSRVDSKQFPVWAIFFNFAVGMFLFLPLPGWQKMVEFLTSAVVISYAMGPLSLMCLRDQLPAIQRPFKLPVAQPLCLVAFYCCNLISYWTTWDTIYKLAIAICVGILCFIIGSIVNAKHIKRNFDFKALIWLAPYLSGLVAMSYLGDKQFGGIGKITFGWDFLAIGLFSIIIFYLALALKLPETEVQKQMKIYVNESHEDVVEGELLLTSTELGDK